MKNGALFGRMVSATSGALGEVLSEFTPKIRGNGARRISHFGREAGCGTVRVLSVSGLHLVPTQPEVRASE
jgi:hypothetical protein